VSTPGTEPVFAEPWEAQAFALAVTLQERGVITATEWSDALGAEIATGPVDASYYEHWLTALETVLAGNGALSDADLDDATKAVLATPANKGHHEAHREPVAVDPAR
jgi:nitrile hydratase accessory protein